MNFNMSIELNDNQLREIIVKFLEQSGFKNISHQDIEFIISTQEKGTQHDPYYTNVVTGVKVKNIQFKGEIQ